MSKYGVFSSLYSPVFGLNTEIYRFNKEQKTSVFAHFSHSKNDYGEKW